MNKNIKKKFGRNLRKYRKMKGFSQEDLSLELDLDGSYIGKVENAKLNITIDKIISIADFWKLMLLIYLSKITGFSGKILQFPYAGKI